MGRNDRLTESGEIVDNLALAGITFELADYGRLAVTCHCGRVPWRLRRDVNTSQPGFSEISRVFTRDGAARSRGRFPFFRPPPWSRALPPTRRSSTNIGALYGEWLDGNLFDSNRYVDRFLVSRGKIVRMDVWNHRAEILRPELVRRILAVPYPQR